MEMGSPYQILNIYQKPDVGDKVLVVWNERQSAEGVYVGETVRSKDAFCVQDGLTTWACVLPSQMTVVKKASPARKQAVQQRWARESEGDSLTKPSLTTRAKALLGIAFG
jgi:hypothetical protein